MLEISQDSAKRDLLSSNNILIFNQIYVQNLTSLAKRDLLYITNNNL